MRAARLLQDEGVPFHVITVLTERALDAPDELFDFYVANGIREVGFNVEEIEGAHGRSSLAGAESRTGSVASSAASSPGFGARPEP